MKHPWPVSGNLEIESRVCFTNRDNTLGLRWRVLDVSICQSNSFSFCKCPTVVQQTYDAAMSAVESGQTLTAWTLGRLLNRLWNSLGLLAFQIVVISLFKSYNAIPFFKQTNARAKFRRHLKAKWFYTGLITERFETRSNFTCDMKW